MRIKAKSKIEGKEKRNNCGDDGKIKYMGGFGKF